MEQAAKDYANIFNALNFQTEIQPMAATCDMLLSRIAEFEALLSSVKVETTEVMDEHLLGILSFANQFRQLQGRIDDLDNLTQLVSDNMDAMERSIDIAEEELHVTDYSLRGLLLKPLMAKAAKVDGGSAEVERSNLRDGVFQPVAIFKSADFFDDPTPSLDRDNA